MDFYVFLGVKEIIIAVHCASEQSGSVTFFSETSPCMYSPLLWISMKLHDHDVIILDSHTHMLSLSCVGILCEGTAFSRAILDCCHATTTGVVMIPVVHSIFQDDGSKEGIYGRLSVHSACMYTYV